MKFKKLLALSLISTMSISALMLTACEDKKDNTTDKTAIVEDKSTKKDTSNDDTSNETTASEEVEEVRYTEDGYRIVDTINGDYSDVEVGEIVFDDKEGIYKQYQGDGCWMRNPFDEDTVVQSEPRPITDWDEIAASSRGNVEDKIAYQQAYEEAKASGLFDSLQ